MNPAVATRGPSAPPFPATVSGPRARGAPLFDPSPSSPTTTAATAASTILGNGSRRPQTTVSMEPAPLPATPPPATSGPLDADSPFYLSPKSPKQSSEVGRTRSQTRRTLGSWQLGKTIGQGSMGRVRIGYNVVTTEQVAVKIIPRVSSESSNTTSRRGDATRPKDENREVRAIREAAIVTLLRHPYICAMRDVIITQGHFYLFFEYVDGGQMLDYIISHGKLREKHARKFARQILSALDYCHRNSIVHRDLKIENILISKSGSIKIIDFGLSNLYSARSLLTTYCGSLYFAAPELLNAKAYTGPEVDLWSFGVVLYVLLCGKVPFDDQSMAALHAKIKRGVVDYPNWLTSDAKNLLSKILVVDASKRATLTEIAQHPWMSKGDGPIENYFPTRLPLALPLDDEVIRGMKGFEFGTEEEIRQHLTSIVQSSAYVKACEQYQKLLEAATSSAIAEKSEKRKAFSLEFYKRKSSTTSSSWSENGATSATSLQFDDPTNAFDPLLSVYYLVREKQERDKQSSDLLARSSTGLVSPKAERSLRLPSIPLPEAAHTGEASYEITAPPDKASRRSPSFRPRAKSRGDDDISGLMATTSLAENIPPSPRSKLLDDLTGGKGGSLLRRISTKWSREPIRDWRKDSKTSVPISTPPQVEITTPSKTLASRKSREIDPFSPSSPTKSIIPLTTAAGLGRSTSISEADYRRRHAGALSDDESSTRRRGEWPASPQTPSSAGSAKSTPGARTRSMGHARHATISAARRANERQDRDFWSGPLAGDSTIPEEMDPRDRTALKDDQFSRPVHLKGLFSVATTSTKPVQTMRSDLVRVLDHLGITHDEIKGGFFCMHRPSIALDSVQEPLPPVEEFSAGKKSRRRLSFGSPIAAAAQLAGFGSSEKRVRPENESDASAESVPELTGRAELSGPGNAMIIQFEIYIVKFPLLSLHGIQFKRVGGDVWQYKNACVKILSELNW